MSTGTLNAPNPSATRDPASFNAEDWAIVVGIDVYPRFKNLNLQGSSNDAFEMHAWLTGPAPTAGGVPLNQAILIRSSDYLGPRDSPPSDRPKFNELEQALLGFDDLAQANRDAGRDSRIGRRLYLYFSGHGCAPEQNESALLAADASPDRSGNHIAGRLWADIFRIRGYFDEIILLMDCCRESFPTIQIRKPALDQFSADSAAVKNGRKFYGFATKWSLTTKEIPINGVMRGVFTYALLQGLGGKAVNSDGLITAASLAVWLSKNMKDCLLPQQQNDPDVPKKPDLDYDYVEASEIVLARGPAFKSVPIAIPVAWQGGPVELQDGSFNLLYKLAVASAVWDLQLIPAMYLLRNPVTGARVPLIVD